VLVVKTGDALPDQGGSGTSGNYEDVDPAYVILDASSRTLFAARYSSVNYNGIYRADADGQIECLVTIFDAVPGGVLTAFGGQLAASPSGRWIAFVGVRNDLSTGIFVWDDTTGLAGILAAATTATTVPGESVPFDDNWSGMSIDDSGELCFAGSSGASFHTWRWTAVGLVNLARTGEAMPLVAAETVDLSLAEGICASGKVTVRASAETTGSVRLFRFDATPAAEAVLIPGAGAPSGDAWLELVDAADVRTSAGGWVSFLGVETGSGQTVLAADGGGSAREVARIGGEVPGTSESITGIPRTRLGGGKVVYLASTAAGEYLVGQGSSGTDAVIAEPSATVTGLVDDCFFVSESGAVVYTAELVGGGTSVMTGE